MASARIRAATKLLNRGYGPPPQSIEVLTPSSEIPEFPTPEETYAEVRRRGLLPVLELVAEEMEREDRGSHHRREAEDPASFARGDANRATNKDTNNRSSARIKKIN